MPGNDDRAFNKAWYDAENDTVFDLGHTASKKPISTDPICIGSHPGAFGQTYCEAKFSQGQCTITICQAAMKGRFLALSDLGDTDLTDINGASASIDSYALTSTTILHEASLKYMEGLLSGVTYFS